MLGVIFDWDGVVINSADLHEKSREILLKSRSHTIILKKVLAKGMRP